MNDVSSFRSRRVVLESFVAFNEDFSDPTVRNLHGTFEDLLVSVPMRVHVGPLTCWGLRGDDGRRWWKVMMTGAWFKSL